MYDIRTDVLDNRIYIHFKGRMDISELKLVGTHINQEAKLLKEGFGAILDFTEFVPGMIDSRQIMLGIVHNLRELHMGKAISVVRDIAAKEAISSSIEQDTVGIENLDAIEEEPWEVALSIRGAEKMLDRFAQIGADGTPMFTKRLKVLLIDDELSLLTVLSAVLKRAGYDVITAVNGAKGIEQAKNNLPDIIICDIMMPPPNGFRVRETLSEDNLTSSIPFIFLTARTAKGDTVYALKTGADDYITKPFDKGELLARMEAILRRRKQN